MAQDNNDSRDGHKKYPARLKIIMIAVMVTKASSLDGIMTTNDEPLAVVAKGCCGCIWLVFEATSNAAASNAALDSIAIERKSISADCRKEF